MPDQPRPVTNLAERLPARLQPDPVAFTELGSGADRTVTCGELEPRSNWKGR